MMRSVPPASAGGSCIQPWEMSGLIHPLTQVVLTPSHSLLPGNGRRGCVAVAGANDEIRIPYAHLDRALCAGV
jgi:hypothetical protein